MLFSASAFIADRYAAYAERVLDDPETETLDVRDLSEETLPVYEDAIEAVTKAVRFAPLHAEYRSSLGDLYSRIDVWNDTMRLMRSDPDPAGPKPGSDMHGPWWHAMKEALALDPSNVDLHLLLGRQLIARGEAEAARKQLLEAAACYPVNSPTRYAVAMGLLAMGYREDARDQALLLAQHDDSYRLDDDDPRSNLVREQRPSGYQERLTGSYLFKAMEIVWRTSSKDPKSVRAIVPDDVDATEAARMFFEQKGIESKINTEREEPGPLTQ